MVLATICTVIVLSGSLSSTRGSIAIVRMEKVLSKYSGAIDARSSFTRLAQTWKSNIDTLRSEYSQALLDYEQQRGKITDTERSSREAQLARMQQNIAEYTSAIEDKAATEQGKLTERLVKIVKVSVENASKDLGYDVVLAINDDGFLLYNSEAVDVTEEVIEYLQSTYRGEFRKELDKDIQ